MTVALAKYEQAKSAVALCVKVDEAKDIHDKAEALRVYAVQANDPELETWAAEIKIRARRRIGELSAAIEPAQGQRTDKLLPPGGRSSKSEALRAAGLSVQVAHRCEQIAAIPEREFEQVLAEKKAKGQPVTTKELLSTVVRKAKVASRQAESRGERANTACTLADLGTLVARGAKFGAIYADPPWSYDNQGTRASTDNHYGTMTVGEIAALPVGELAAERSHLWLWTTNAFLFECPRLFEAWGFEFKSSYVWVKPQMGIGNYLRNSHEFLLLATRGGLTGQARDVMSWGEFPRARHSQKPEEIRRDVVERLSPGPYLELFGRRLVDGWTVWGNEVDRGGLYGDTDVVELEAAP